MEKNISQIDQKIRYILGVIAFSMAFYNRDWALAMIGFVLIASAYIGWCSVYAFFKVSTTKKNS